jgi:hypothetical protein
MATSFETVYTNFLGKVQDQTFFEIRPESREGLLLGFLNTSQSKFFRTCKTDLADRDEILGQFNNDLTNEEIDILGTGMVWAWYCYRLNNADLLDNFLSNRDYSLAAAPSNMLKEVRATKEDAFQSFNKDITMYSYATSDIESLKPQNL